MQSVSAAFTAEERDSVRNIAQNLQISWKKESTLGKITFTIGVSTIGGTGVIGANPGAIGSPANYRYFDESAYVTNLAWERGLSMPTGGLAKGMAEARLDNTGEFNRGYSLSFNGTSSVVTTSFNTWSSQMTFAGWINRTDKSANHAILGSANGAGLIIRFDSGSNQFRFWADASSSSATWTDTAVNAAGMSTATWVHWCVTADLTNNLANLYINGNLVGGSPISYAVDYGTPGNLSIGRRSAASDYFKGLQDEIRVWNTILTASQVTGLYVSRIIPQDGLILEYLFDEGSGTIARESTSGYNGAITDGTYSTSTNGQIVSQSNGRFTPRYMGGNSELFTAILPRRPFIINAGFEVDGIEQEIPQFSGILTKQPYVDMRNREVRLVGSDYIDFFQNRYLDQESMVTGQRTDQIMSSMLRGTLGMSTAQFDLDTGINVIPFVLFEKGTRMADIFNDLAEAENGHFYQDEAGIFKFENRQHWDSSPYNAVQRLVLTGQVISSEAPTDDHIINVVEISSKVWQKQPLQNVFTLPTYSPIEVPGNSSIDKFFEFEDPILQLTDPSSGGSNSFYVANTRSDGTGTNATSSVSFTNMGTFAKAVKYRITNSSSASVFLVQIQLSGRAAIAPTNLYLRLKDSSSLTAYEERPYSLDNPYIQNESWANSLAQLLLDDYSNPENLQRITIRAIPELQLGDLISWQGRHWRIYDIKTTLDPDVGYIQELTMLQRRIVSYFRIGISTIGSTDAIAP